MLVDLLAAGQVPDPYVGTHRLLSEWVPHRTRGGDYYVRFVHGVFLHDAPADVDLAPTSEDGYPAILAYAALWGPPANRCWLDIAHRAAD